MKKGFSLGEIIISISLLSVVFVFTMFIIKKSEPTYADPYESIRSVISDATNVFLNSNIGNYYKNELYKNGEILISTNELISEGLLEESYFVGNINEEKEVKDIDIIVSLGDEGFMNYTINIV